MNAVLQAREIVSFFRNDIILPGTKWASMRNIYVKKYQNIDKSENMDKHRGNFRKLPKLFSFLNELVGRIPQHNKPVVISSHVYEHMIELWR